MARQLPDDFGELVQTHSIHQLARHYGCGPTTAWAMRKAYLSEHPEVKPANWTRTNEYLCQAEQEEIDLCLNCKKPDCKYGRCSQVRRSCRVRY